MNTNYTTEKTEKPLPKNSPQTIFNTIENYETSKIFTSTSKNPEKKKINICKICQKQFSTSGNLRNHIMTIHQNYRPFKCTFPGCQKKYSIESRLQVHIRTHTGAKPFICQICNKSFNEKGNLKTHLRFHSEFRPFKCTLCEKSYKTNGHLKDHIEIQHNLVKKYICQFCNKKFGRISTLKAHIRTHTGEKSFKCKIEGCEKWFSEKGNMEIHYQRHLKKLKQLNSNNFCNQKKYGIKKIEEEFEAKIKDALNQLNTNNHQNTINNKNKKNNNVIVNNSDISIKNSYPNFLFNNNNNFINNNLNNDQIISDNLCKFFPLPIFQQSIKNCHQSSFSIESENSNTSSPSLLNKSNNNLNNKLDFMLDKNEDEVININNINNIADCVTRPCSNMELCNKKKQNDIFAKDEDLFSLNDENYPSNIYNKNFINVNNSLNGDNFSNYNNEMSDNFEIGLNKEMSDYDEKDNFIQKNYFI